MPAEPHISHQRLISHTTTTFSVGHGADATPTCHGTPHVLIHFFILQQTFAEDLLRGGCFAGGIHTRVDSKYHEVTVSVVGL